MKRIHNTKYNICIANHRITKWIIPANEGYFVPLVLMNYLEQQCLESLNHDIDQLNSNIKAENTEESKNERGREVCDVDIQLYYPQDVFVQFCSWIHVGTSYLKPNMRRYVYPTLMKWCGIPVDEYFYPDFKEPIWDEQNKGLPKLMEIVNTSIELLSRLRPNASGCIIDPSWIWSTTYATYKTTPLLHTYTNLCKDFDQRPSVLEIGSTSPLYQVPQLEKIMNINFSDLSLSDSFFVFSRNIVELDRALGDRKILLVTTAAPEIPKWIQLFIDTIALSKNISVEDTRRRCVEAFDVTDEFWNDVEMHIGNSQWEQLKNYHHEHQNKRHKQEYKSYLEQFLDIYSSEFDEEWKAKMITRFNWAVEVVQLLESIEK